MPKYEYVALNASSATVNGTIDANNVDEARQALWAKDYMVLEVTPYAQRIGANRISQHGKATMDDKIVFFQQLSTLINAAVPLFQTLQMIINQSESIALAKAANAIAQDVAAGLPLWVSMQKHSRLFDYPWIQMVKTGEESGRLDLVLNQLAENLEARKAIQQKMVSALFYPAILIATAIGALIFMVVKVIPQFAQFFASTGQELPALTRGVVMFADIMQHYLPVIVAAIALTVYTLRAYIRTEVGHFHYDFIRMRLPIIGDLTICIALEKFTDMFQLLLNSGIDAISAISAMEGSFADNHIYRRALREIKTNVSMGQPISAALTAASVFPPMVINLVNVGEESGRLPDILKKLNIYYRRRIEAMITRLTALFEPLIILFIGGVVAVLVLSIYLPIFKLATGAGIK